MITLLSYCKRLWRIGTFSQAEPVNFKCLDPDPGEGSGVDPGYLDDLAPWLRRQRSEFPWAATARTARRVACAVHKAAAPDRRNLLQCNGEAAAQSVAHFHMHILPRKAGDHLRSTGTSSPATGRKSRRWPGRSGP
ncbi:MAG: HIT family protein [Kiloniellaceae bacterium]